MPRNESKEGRYRVRLESFSPGEETPDVLVTAVNEEMKPLHTVPVDEAGAFDLPEDALKAAHLILIGPRAQEGATIESRSILRYRPEHFLDLLGETGVLEIPARYWRGWWGILACVTGSVRRCRPIWWWYLDNLRVFAGSQRYLGSVASADRLPSLPASARTLPRSAAIRASLSAIPRPAFPPLICQTVCNGTVEVYRRTCCCHREWLVEDPRLPRLIRDLEGIVQVLEKFPVRPLPDPPLGSAFPGEIAKLPFLKEGALDEKTLNARQDLSTIRSLSAAEAADYIRARRYLWWCACGRSVKMAQGAIQPGGTFSICWREFPRRRNANCYDQYAYVVKQIINGVTVTIYNGLAANIWFNPGDEAELVSHSLVARTCRDNGTRDDAYVYLELIGDTEAWHLKTPASSAWDRVATPAFNDGLAFPSEALAAGAAPYDRNWGGTLKIYYKFSEGLKDVGGRYYRLSVTAADASGGPSGARHYLGSGLAWEKSVGGGVTVPVSLGPVSVGGQDHLYLIPYDADADWNADQYHAYLDTNQLEWNDPDVRHLLTVEIFDDAGRRLRPNGTPATGQPGVESEAPFTYRRQFQELGATANVPFGALTHMLWWDNRPAQADLETLIRNGLLFDAECQYLQGTADSTFSVGYRAYHWNPLFQESHAIWWYRGSGATPGSTGLLTQSSLNVGRPPDPAGQSGTNTFADMLRTDLEPDRLKCSFVVQLVIYVKTFDGENILSYLDASDQWAFSVEING